MNEAHQRFQEWLAAGADGEPPRDLAFHASVCADCHRSIAALDRLAAINLGRASLPASRETVPEAREGAMRAGRLVGAVAGVVLSAVVLGIGVSQLIPLLRGGGEVGQATATPGETLTVASNTPPPSESFTSAETASPSQSPTATPGPTPIPTPQPTAPPKPGSPGAPTGLTATASIGQITLKWKAPASNGGSPITRYDVYRDGSKTKLYSTTTPTLTEFVGNGGSHVYRVTAVNKVGSGPYSNPASATTPDVPSVPTNVAATGGNGSIDVSWSAPASNGGSAVTGYDVYREDMGSTPICSTSGLSCTDSPLGDGVTHTYTVKASNVIGQGAGASDVATTWNLPSVPTNVAATGGNGSIDVSWSAPASNGGSAVTGYDVYREDMGSTPVCTTSGLSCTDSLLGDGITHTYTVKASNVIGQGPGASDTATTWNKPGAFTLTVTASSTQGQIDLNWTTPAPNGSAITEYDIYYSPTNFITFVPNGTTTWSDTGLTSGNVYAYYVVAVNAVGSTSSNVDSATAP